MSTLEMTLFSTCASGKLPWVTYGKELCKPYLELLMGRIYVKHATSYSWRGIIYNLYSSSWEGFMQKSKIVNACSFPCNWLWISLLSWSKHKGKIYAKLKMMWNFPLTIHLQMHTQWPKNDIYSFNFCMQWRNLTREGFMQNQ